MHVLLLGRELKQQNVALVCNFENAQRFVVFCLTAQLNSNWSAGIFCLKNAHRFLFCFWATDVNNKMWCWQIDAHVFFVFGQRVATQNAARALIHVGKSTSPFVLGHRVWNEWRVCNSCLCTQFMLVFLLEIVECAALYMEWYGLDVGQRNKAQTFSFPGNCAQCFCYWADGVKEQ